PVYRLLCPEADNGFACREQADRAGRVRRRSHQASPVAYRGTPAASAAHEQHKPPNTSAQTRLRLTLLTGAAYKLNREMPISWPRSCNWAISRMLNKARRCCLLSTVIWNAPAPCCTTAPVPASLRRRIASRMIAFAASAYLKSSSRMQGATRAASAIASAIIAVALASSIPGANGRKSSGVNVTAATGRPHPHLLSVPAGRLPRRPRDAPASGPPPDLRAAPLASTRFH